MAVRGRAVALAGLPMAILIPTTSRVGIWRVLPDRQ